MQNRFVESFNGSLRTECLNETLFSSLTQVRTEIKAWENDYNKTDHSIHWAILRRISSS